jgi:dTDP-4-dehydrorhamnose reductase
MKILILGSSGLTGYKLALIADEKKLEIYGTYNKRSIPAKIANKGTFFKTNLNEVGELAKIFNQVKPDVLLNCVALHDVDYCERNPQEALLINASLVEKIVSLCNAFGTRFIHFSTDYVFDGKKGSSYIETDHPNPLSIYGKSKLAGEQYAKKAQSYSIIRPSVIYGWTPSEAQGTSSSSGKSMNFALWTLSKLVNGDVLNIVIDQFTSPTFVDSLAEAALALASIAANETYHIAGNFCINRYDFTVEIAKAMGYSDAIIKPTETRFLKQLAERPFSSCLNCNKVQKQLNMKIPTLEESLNALRSEIESESPSLVRN